MFLASVRTVIICSVAILNLGYVRSLNHLYVKPIFNKKGHNCWNIGAIGQEDVLNLKFKQQTFFNWSRAEKNTIV